MKMKMKKKKKMKKKIKNKPRIEGGTNYEKDKTVTARC